MARRLLALSLTVSLALIVCSVTGQCPPNTGGLNNDGCGNIGSGNKGRFNRGSGNVGDYNNGNGNVGVCNKGDGFVGTGQQGPSREPGCSLTCPAGTLHPDREVAAPGTPCPAGTTFRYVPGTAEYGYCNLGVPNIDLPGCCRCIPPDPVTPHATVASNPNPNILPNTTPSAGPHTDLQFQVVFLGLDPAQFPAVQSEYISTLQAAIPGAQITILSVTGSSARRHILNVFTVIDTVASVAGLGIVVVNGAIISITQLVFSFAPSFLLPPGVAEPVQLPIEVPSTSALCADNCPYSTNAGLICGACCPDPTKLCPAFRKTPPYNGCGPESGGEAFAVVIRALVTFAGGDSQAVQASCNAHDVCYSTPGRSQGQCDLDFYYNARKLCSVTTVPGTPASIGCLNAATGLYLAVNVGGAGPHADAQADTLAFAASCQPVSARNGDGAVTCPQSPSPTPIPTPSPPATTPIPPTACPVRNPAAELGCGAGFIGCLQPIGTGFNKICAQASLSNSFCGNCDTKCTGGAQCCDGVCNPAGNCGNSVCTPECPANDGSSSFPFSCCDGQCADISNFQKAHTQLARSRIRGVWRQLRFT
ncbi:hypothetical protein WJX72_010254 [[Myrmecia] bisecta]|uniref:Uncharacterized protein n=1 Tax=[Myrmecia] bisecta TaxID=41462 RepID=A0AAW1P7E4_9CHLO